MVYRYAFLARNAAGQCLNPHISMLRHILDALYSALDRVYVLRQLSYALHGFLVGLHLALGILHLLPLEQSITFSLSPDYDPSDTSLAVAMTMSGTIFATVRTRVHRVFYPRGTNADPHSSTAHFSSGSRRSSR